MSDAASGPPPGPPPGSPDDPGAAGSGAASGGGNNRNLLIGVGVLVVIALVAVGVFFLASDDDDDDAATTVASGEVFLEPANEPGPDPFTEEIDVEPEVELVSQPVETTTTTTAETTTTTTEADTTTTTTEAETTTTTAAGAAAIPSAVGSTPGLYGGTQDVARCDPAQMQAFLEANPDKAAAWVAAQNADPSFKWSGGDQLTTADVGAYISTLTPITLITDTRVTNHGYVDGRPTARAAVLQAGTAVLVDEYGTPRAKCNCGNPLTAPTPVQGTTVYTGNTWDGFSPATVVVVQPATVVVQVFILVDIYVGTEFARPASTTGEQDKSAGEVVEPTPEAEPTPEPEPTAEAEPPPPPPPPLEGGILTSGDFCEAIAEYDALSLEFALEIDDEGNVENPEALIDFFVAAFTDLEQLAPPDIQPDVAYLLAQVQAGNIFFGEGDPEYEAADARWYQWTLDNCNYDWYANDQ